MAERRKLRVRLEHLREWRYSQYLTQAELAERAGVSANTVVRLESPSGMANTPSVRALAAGLGIAVDTLLFERPPRRDDLAKISK